MNFPFTKSRLRIAIERGLANGKLEHELKELGKILVKSRSDALAICWGLEHLDTTNPQSLAANAYTLATLFQEVEGGVGGTAFNVLQEQGIPLLLRYFDLIIQKPGQDEVHALMFLLKIFALYGTVEGTLKIIETAQRSFNPADYMWNVILRVFLGGHPEKDLLYNSLRDPLPDGFIAVSLLDAANSVLIHGDSMAHPFDTPQGKQRLRDWLTASDPKQFSYAHSATAALPFISNPERDSLLDLAMAHPDQSVRIEAAWAAAKLGRNDGLQQLAQSCRDFRTAQTAKRYLSELGREDVIPAEANSPDFVALAEFCEWCAHPNELARNPDKLEIFDHRELRWPPERTPKPFWLIKYTMFDTTGLEDDNIGCGLVGSMTFCFFSYDLHQRPPEDGYAIHCYWEMKQNGLIDETDVQKEPAEYANLLQQLHGSSLENPRMQSIAELSPELRYPQRLVGLASARLNGEDGYVVLDGPRSQWYSKSDFPLDSDGSSILEIHVGRFLLGLSGEADRKKYLVPPQPPKSPEQIITAYQKLLLQAQCAQGEDRKDAFQSWGPLGKYLDQYVDSLLLSGRTADVRTVIQTLTPHWDDVGGFSTLGSAAFKASQFDLAEDFLLKYRNQCIDYEHDGEMALLAEIWCNTGKRDAGKDLLLHCLAKILQDSKTAEEDDLESLEKGFQTQRTAFLKLFPEHGAAFLTLHAIPQSIPTPH